MSSNKCARCDQTVYPVEGLRCLDKIWHKGCFKCQECNMTLNLKNYKGFDKKPYCNAHCPQAKATTVADTPEIRRLAENTRIQSQAKYHEDFEKSKGKGFTAIADDPETLRIKNTSKIISNVAYHGELERKKQMEERRGSRNLDDQALLLNNNNNNITNNNNNDKHTNGHVRTMQVPQMMQDPSYQSQHITQAQAYHLKQQHLIKQQQLQNAQNHNSQILVNRHSMDSSMPQQKSLTKLQSNQQPQNYQLNHQQIVMRQQQQQQQQQMMLHHQQNRHSMDPSLPIVNRQIKQQIVVNHNNSNHSQQIIKSSPQMNPIQHTASGHQVSPVHLIGGQPQHHVINHMNGQRMTHPNQSNVSVGPGVHPHHLHMIHHPGFSPQHAQVQGPINEIMPKQQQQQQYVSQPRQIIHQQQLNNPQMRLINQQQPIHPQPMPRRIFRAIYDYVANDVDEVSFFENDILIDCVNVDGNWLIGKVARSGQTGMLPANYVAEVIPA